MDSKDSRDISATRDDNGSATSNDDDDYGNNCRLIKNELDTNAGDKEFIAMDMIAIKNISGAISSDVVLDNRNGGNAEQDITAGVSNKVKKSSDRNAINFMGYVILVIILTYCYFGTLISDYLANGPNDKKFIKTITSTELIVILWFTIIYGTCLLLFLRFKVLKLERDPNSEKRKKKARSKSEDFAAFLSSNRNKKSFKNCNLSHVIADSNNGNNGDSNQNKNMPFWKK